MSMQAMARWLGGAKKVAPLLLAATLAAVAALGLASAASAATFSNTDGPITINDGSDDCFSGEAATAPGTATPYPSEINVSGLTGLVTDVNVTISGLSHEWPDDIGLLLVSPAGKSVILMADSGGGLAVSGINLTFDDAASDPVPDNTALVSGSTYRPNRGTNPSGTVINCLAPASFPGTAPAGPYGTLLSVFNGTNPNGNWQLYVIDDARRITGSITGWSLDISASSVVPTTKDDCKKGGWKALGWPDQGTCITAWNNQNSQ
jgi:subtilisin-like proprotein convertase family protein